MASPTSVENPLQHVLPQHMRLLQQLLACVPEAATAFYEGSVIRAFSLLSETKRVRIRREVGVDMTMFLYYVSESLPSMYRYDSLD